MAQGQGFRHDERRHGLAAVVAALNAGQPERAWATCATLLAWIPDDPVVNQLASDAALRLGHHSKAAALAERSLARRPDHVATLVLLGRARNDGRLFGAAASAFGQAAAIAPDRPDAAFSACAAQLRSGDPAAVAGLDRLTTLFPRHAEGWEEIGGVLLEAGKREAAAVCLSRALQAAPRFTLAMRLGLLLRDLGRAGEAAACFAEAAALDPQAVRAWFLLGLCSQDAGAGAGAAEAYRKALRLDPGVAEAAVNLGTVLQEAGDLDGAKDAYALALARRADTFGRIAQAMTTPRKGELWLDLAALRRALASRAATPGAE